MSDEQEKIEHMVQQGRLTRSEADELLAALEPEEARQQRTAAHEEHHSARRTLRIRVDEARGEHVDLGFPMALADIGLNMLSRRPKAMIDVDGTPLPIDLNEIRRLIADPTFSGELVNVHTGDGEHVVLSVE